MRRNIIYSCVLVTLFSFSGSAQINSDDVLFTVENDAVLAQEFIRVYNKNLDLVQDESQKDIDEYLKLYINYKLKLAEARSLGYHEKASYVNELNGYKKQLAKNYLTDNEVTDALVREAYDRITSDVYVQHILLRMDLSATDTTATYNKLVSLKERLKNEDFNDLQKELHDGKRVFVEDLGYFSAFKMVYEFENVAFTTQKGEVSNPFRTQFGYHILKVLDNRKSRGEVTVGHIMISNNQKDSLVDPESRINEVYKLLEQGAEFESLAKQFSEDKSSAAKGGKLEPFKGGQLSSSVFEDEAFALQNVGDISQPFPTEFGWHIAKLYSKNPVGSFDELQYDLKNRVSRDSRSKLISSSMQNRLREKYNVSSINPARDYFVSIMTDDFYNRRWKLPQDFNRSKELTKIGTKELRFGDFSTFLISQQKSVNRGKSLEQIIDDSYQAFLNRNVLLYHEENLENDNIEFANILNEYREGLLLFDLMENKIWNVVKDDTVGIERYFQTNKAKYTWPQRIEATVATSPNKNSIEQVKNLLERGVGVLEIKNELNSKSQSVIFTSGIMDNSHQSLPKGLDFNEGISKIYQHNDAYFVVNVTRVIPESNKTLTEARGQIVSDYQVQVEEDWVASLLKKYKVRVNTEVLNKVKSQINN